MGGDLNPHPDLASAFDLPTVITETELADRLAAAVGAPEPEDDLSRVLWVRMAQAIESELLGSPERSFDTAEIAHYLFERLSRESSRAEMEAWRDYLGLSKVQDLRRITGEFGKPLADAGAFKLVDG